MGKLWEGRFTGAADRTADDFNSSLRFDCRMANEDVAGSLAHAKMLYHAGILSGEDARSIEEGLLSIAEDLRSGSLTFEKGGEDIHTFIEEELTHRVGQAGKRLHTARSRNDQVALDLRLYLRTQCKEVGQGIETLARAILEKAEESAGMIMPGYTHLQRAQPVTMGHHLLAYVMMLLRDAQRLSQASARMNVSPLGCCALAGTTYPIDREETAAALGFDGICRNSIDAVSDRDFALELLSVFSILMMHLSRLSEELLLWTSWEFRFVELDDAFTTGSSIMPQKKNADMAELARGKTGRVYGDLMALLTVMKGLPLAYDKDMQEDKEAIFDALDTVKQTLSVFAPMLRTMCFFPETMRAAAGKGYINATDLADYLVGKGLPFRTAYQIVGQTVKRCLEEDVTLEQFPLESYRAICPAFSEDLYEAIALERCLARRDSAGGPGPGSLAQQIRYAKEALGIAE